MKRILILLLAVTLILGVSTACITIKDKTTSPNNTDNEAVEPIMKTVKSSEDGSSLTLDVPETWENNTAKAATAASISMLSNDGDEALIVIEEKAADFEANLKINKYADMIVQVMQGNDNASDWQIGKLSDTTVGSDITAKQREISVSLDGVNIKYLQTVFKTEDSYVEILEWTTPSKFDESKKVFLSILKTVKF
jgi:hypothetical protein